ncbi:MAG: hypothetical protein VX399_09635, partial [SAR324 cluster bacterium]|nr:hypothetical protein [SAR324 cluster bacterium]
MLQTQAAERFAMHPGGHQAPHLFRSLLVCFLVLMLFGQSLKAQCYLTEGLSEKQQAEIARQMFEDGLYKESWNIASCYLTEFHSGSIREEMMFLQASALFRTGSFSQALRA